jgi:hypothetical protein
MSPAHSPHRSPRVRVVVWAFWIVSLVAAGCAARGPAIGTGEKPPTTSGTISGVVRTAGSNTPLSGRLVTATETTTGAKYEASTSATGGYTMKVPIGRYRLEVELREGETVAEGPSELNLSTSDLDAGRDFVIAAKSPGGI